MERLERFYKIDQLLQRGNAVPFSRLCKELGVSAATVKRDLEYMRNRFNAPIEWDRAMRGYKFVAKDKYGPNYQLPGVWFNASEAHALLTMQYLLENIEPGLIGPQLKPLEKRLSAILGGREAPFSEVRRRIRILGVASRKAHLKLFDITAFAVLKRRRLTISYLVRSRNEITDRVISPQRLVHYRDNWYLDAWCHLRSDIRSFAVECIQEASLLGVSAKEISDTELDSTLGSGYGIFSGKITKTAKLRFTRERARWVALESWHPKQHGTTQSDGSYILELPYSDDRELIGDILRFGPDVEVLEPTDLRHRIIQQLQLAASVYL